MPRWTFENKITFGNVLTIVITLGGLLAGYMTLVQQVGATTAAVSEIPAIKERVTVIEGRINAGQNAREDFQRRTDETLKELRQQTLAIYQAIARLEAKQ